MGVFCSWDPTWLWGSLGVHRRPARNSLGRPSACPASQSSTWEVNPPIAPGEFFGWWVDLLPAVELDLRDRLMAGLANFSRVPCARLGSLVLSWGFLTMEVPWFVCRCIPWSCFSFYIFLFG